MSTIVTTTCAVCRDLRRAEIEAAMIEGRSARDIAKQYGYTNHVTIWNHAKKHLPRRLSQSRQAQNLIEVDELVLRLKTYLEELEEMFREDKKNVKRRFQALGAMDRMQKAIELMHRMIEPAVKANVTINLVTNPDFVRFKTLMFEALIPFPDAMEAVSRAFEQELMERNIATEQALETIPMLPSPKEIEEEEPEEKE